MGVPRAYDFSKKLRNQANYNSVVGYVAEKARYAKRTSAIIDPPDGRLPMWTMEQVKYYEMREAMTAGRGDSDWTVDRPTSERYIPFWRCRSWTTLGWDYAGPGSRVPHSRFPHQRGLLTEARAAGVAGPA